MNKKWQEQINDELQVALAKYTDKQLNFTLTNPGWSALACFLLLLGIIPGIILFIFIAKAKRIERDILAKLNITQYYDWAFNQESNNEFNVKTIAKNFVNPIQNFMPTTGRVLTDLVLNISSNQANYSLGSLTQQIERQYRDAKGNIHRTYEYTRYPYLTISLNKSLEMHATIRKAKSFLGIFKTHDNTKLESTEFEKIYAINSDDQIAIRKLLTPKIMSNLIDQSKQIKVIPNLDINHTHLTYAFEPYSVSSWNDIKGIVGHIDLKKKREQILSDICTKITTDYQKFVAYKQWFEVYQIVSN